MKTLNEAIEKLMELSSGDNKEEIARKYGLLKQKCDENVDKFHIGKLEMIELLSFIYGKEVKLPKKHSNVVWIKDNE